MIMIPASGYFWLFHSMKGLGGNSNYYNGIVSAFEYNFGSYSNT